MKNRGSQRWTAAVAVVCFGTMMGGAAVAAGPPSNEAACVVTAGNRSAPLAADGSYTIYNIPGNIGAIRARAVCSDGAIGQSAVGFTNPSQADTVELGPIEWGRLDPVPLAATLSAPNPRLRSGESSQLKLTAVAVDGTMRDVTSRSEGTTYSLSNDLFATIAENGLVKILATFAPDSSARIIASATAEGSVSSTFQYVLGPRGQLSGEVRRAEGGGVVVNAQVSVLRLQPMEHAGTAVTDATGRFLLTDVSAGRFLVFAIDPANGDRAQGEAGIQAEGQTAEVVLTLNGQGTVDATVVDAANAPKAGAIVTFTALGANRDTRTQTTDALGHAVFSSVPAGDFTVSTRDPATRLVGTAVARLAVGATLPLTLRLQPIGAIEGVVKGVDGRTLQSGVQVRILSRERGLLTQVVTAEDGVFHFDTLPISDGPFTLDAFVDGRLRAREPGVVIAQANETVRKDIVFGAVGVVAGQVRSLQGEPFADARVTLQSLEGLRLTFEARTNASGRYVMPAVPVGDFDLTAVTTSGRSGHGHGRINADAEQVAADVMIASNSLVGTVYARDRVTPVAGADVYLVSRAFGPRYSYAGVAQALHTTTDLQGRYGFSIDRPDAYLVQSEQGFERGRSEAVIVNLDPSQPLVADISFLAKGKVIGVVKDPNGGLQVDAPVTVRTEGTFTAERTLRTDAQGQYALDGVFVGDVIAVARNEVTHLAGFSRNRLDDEGRVLRLDVTVAGAGVVQGRVLARNGAIVASPVRVTLRSRQSQVANLELPDGSFYRFDGVPIGDVEVEVERLADGDRGLATTRIEAANDSRALDVRLVGQGNVFVKLVDAHGAAVSGARVTVSTSRPFPSSKTLDADTQGLATFEHVFAGDVSVSATKPDPMGAISGSTSLTLLPNEDGLVIVTLSLRPVGRIHGTVLEPNGTTPSGERFWVRMLPEPSSGAFLVQADAQGGFAFEQVPAGSYTVDAVRFYNPAACPRSDRVRGRAANVSLSQSGQDVAVSIQLIGEGSMSGHVTLPDGAPAAGIEIRLTNPDPIYGFNVTCNGRRTYDTVTDASGLYHFSDIPPGAFTLTAENAARTLRAEGTGQVRFAGDAVLLDLALVDSALTMPYTLYDANGFKFDIAGNGSIGIGTNSVFAGAGPDNAGMRLEIVKDGITLPFTNGNGSIGRLTKNGQQLDVDEINAFGVKITRRIYTPRNGYFTRYIETIANPGATPVTLQVRTTSFHRAADGNPRVVDTSDGDTILSVVDAEHRDRWAVIDDQQDADPFTSASIPATGHLFDGVGAAVQVNAASYNLIGQTGKLSYQWGDLSVPPGGEVAVMHFVLHQINRYDAREAALRLAQLPPEAIDDLTTDERQAVRNFAVPEASVLGPLPNLEAGRISGIVYSGDGTTAIEAARVRFKSKHLLFGRERFAISDAQGRFEFRSRLDGAANNAVIPVYAFDLSAVHPSTQAGTATAAGDFATEQTQAIQDLIFVGTGNIRGNVKRHNGALVADAWVRLCRGSQPCGRGSPDYVNDVRSQADGRYALLANPPGDFYLYADKEHPQGAAILGHATVRVTASDTTTRDVSMEPTGSVAGVVRAPDGTPAVGANVVLGSDGRSRSTQTDTAGHYRFFDVPTGSSDLRARDAISGAMGSATITVQTDLETQQDILLSASGTITVHVEFARGLTAANAYVVVIGIGSAMADANGVARFQAPQGSYTIIVDHPDFRSSATRGTAAVAITQSGQQIDVTVRLGPAGIVKGTIVRPDGTTLATGFPYKITPASRPLEVRNGATLPSGTYRVGGVAAGVNLLTAYDPQQHRFAEAEFTIAEDGQEVVVDLLLRDNRITLPATLKDANRFAYDVQRSGALKSGSGAYGDAGALLEVNGQAVVGDSSALLEADARQFTIEQPDPIAGLTVTRKVHVPRGAYYARYVDVLENRTASPITVSAGLTHRYAGGQVVATSSHDLVVDTADRWVMVDDTVDGDILLGGGQPVAADVFAGEAAPLAPSTVSLVMDGTKPRLAEQWNTLTVPAGGRVALLHFSVQQIHRAGAQAAAERLVQLPPEALTDLDPADAAAIVNFALPVGLASTLEPLPSLTGSVRGVNYEGDARTPVRGATMTVQSTHPLFNRVWGRLRNPTLEHCPPGTPVAGLRTLSSIPPGTNPPALGSYVLQGQLTAEDSIALPEGVDATIQVQTSAPCFDWYAGHPLTHVPSHLETVQPSTTRDVLFDTGVFTGSVAGAADFQITQGRVYRSIDDPDAVFHPVYVPIAADGTYVFPGVPAGSFDLLFDTSHPQAVPDDGKLRGQRVDEPMTVGEARVAELPLQPTGQVQGAVVTVNGEASVNAPVTLYGERTQQVYDQCAIGCSSGALARHKGKRDVKRQVRSDSLGRFAFATVPTGNYLLSAVDPISLGEIRATVAVNAGQAVVQNLIHLPIGSISVTVQTAGGVPVGDAYVYITAAAVLGGERIAGRTDPSGRLTIANVPKGTYALRVVDPRYAGDRTMDRTFLGEIAQQGQADAAPIVLGIRANVSIKVVDAAASDAPLANARMRYQPNGVGNPISLGYTDSNGRIGPIVWNGGSYLVLIEAGDGRRAQRMVMVGVTEDGLAPELTIQVGLNPEQVGTLSFYGESHLYSVLVQSGDRLAVTISGAQVGDVPSRARIRADVFNPDRWPMASGYGEGGSGNYAQHNLSGDLQNVQISEEGFYTIAIQPYIPGAFDLPAGYRLAVAINGQAASILSYQGGGTVSGHLYLPDGVTPVTGTPIQLRSDWTPRLFVERITDASGAYVFEDVPQGGFQLQAMASAATSNRTAKVAGTVSAAGEKVITDIRLPAATIVDVTVARADGSPVDTSIPVTFRHGADRESNWTNGSGRLVQIIVSDVPIIVTAGDSSGSAETTVEPADGQTVEVTLRLGGGQVRGRVLDASGMGVAGITVYGRRHGFAIWEFGGRTTDAQGGFDFGDFPGGADVELLVYDPVDYGLYVNRFTVVSDQVNTQDFVLDGRGALEGVVRNGWGAPIGGAEVEATYARDGSDARTSQTRTAADGTYRFDDMPASRAIILEARKYTGFRVEDYVSSPAQATIPANGAQTNADLVVDIPGGRVTVTIREVPGVTWCLVSIANARQSHECSTPFVFDGVPPGWVTVTADESNDGPVVSIGSVTVFVIDGANIDVSVGPSLVSGYVTYSDGAPTLSAVVELRDADGGVRSAETDANGEYKVSGAASGAFSIVATDPASTLSAMGSGVLLNEATPVMLDLILPAHASLNGTVFDPDGQVVPDASVFAERSATPIVAETVSDAGGQYRFERIAPGNLTVSALHPATQNVASADVSATAGLAFTTDLHFPMTGAVRGEVRSGDGSLFADACVKLLPIKEGAAYRNALLETVTDQFGRYFFPDVLLAPIRMAAGECDHWAEAGMADASVTDTAEVIVDVEASGASWLPAYLSGSDGGYDIAPDGVMEDWGYGPQFKDGMAAGLEVNGKTFPAQPAAPWSTLGGLMLGPSRVGGLSVSRTLDVIHDRLLRYVEVIENASAQPVRASIRICYQRRRSVAPLLVSPNDNGGRYGMNGGTDYNDKLVAYVFAGTDSVDRPTVHAANGSPRFEWTWTVNVAPGQRVAYLHYVKTHTSDYELAMRNLMGQLSDGKEPDQFDGLDAADRAAIRNFVVPSP